MRAKIQIERPLPQCADTERALLGAVIRDNAALGVIEEKLTASNFSFGANRRILVAMQALYAAGQTIEEISLCEALKNDLEVLNAGGDAYIAKLADGVYAKAPLEQWCKSVRDAAVLRSTAFAGQTILNDALAPNANAQEVSQRAQLLVSALGAGSAATLPGVLACDVAPERVSWLWHGRIPLAKLTVLDGDPGLGKSAITIDLAARITKGKRMPDDSLGITGGVVLISAEDGAADTIVPRLKGADADLSLVRILQTVSCGDGDRQLEIPMDIPFIERAAKSVGAKLVVIDPLMAFLPSTTNSFRDQDVRRALAPLAAMAERIGAAVLIVRHLNKTSADNALYRGGGSIGIIGAARSGLLVAVDPDDESRERRILASTKCNLGSRPASICYTIIPSNDSILVGWGGESQHSAASLLVTPSGEEVRGAVDEAVEFLRTFLGDGSAAAEEVRREARKAGISDRSLDRAKRAAGVVARRRGFGKGSIWEWEIGVKSATASAKNATNSKSASFEQHFDSTAFESPSFAKSAAPQAMASFGEGVSHFDESGLS